MIVETHPSHVIKNKESWAHISSLNLPFLKGLRVLDLACNRGEVCAWASFSGASRIWGIENDATRLPHASVSIPRCTLTHGEWTSLLVESQDVIVAPARALHADSIEKELALLIDHLSSNGLLVLDMSDLPGLPATEYWKSLMQRCVWRRFGAHLCHIRRKKPLALLCMDRTFSGKSQIAAHIASDTITHIMGDAFLVKLKNNQGKASPALHELLASIPQNDTAIFMAKICRKGLLRDFVRAIHGEAKKQPFVYDGFIPTDFRENVIHELDNLGYFVANIDICSTKMHDPAPLHAGKLEQEFSDFLASLGFASATSS